MSGLRSIERVAHRKSPDVDSNCGLKNTLSDYAVSLATKGVSVAVTALRDRAGKRVDTITILSSEVRPDTLHKVLALAAVHAVRRESCFFFR